MSKEFAKIYNTDYGQILVTLITYGNGSEISIKFNDENSDVGSVHELKLMFRPADVQAGIAELTFDNLNEQATLQLISKAIQNAEEGIDSGIIEDLNDMKTVRH